MTEPGVLALARKYRRLCDLRRRAPGAAPTAELRALASEFPGALRELDALPIELIERRVRELEDAAGGGPSAPWMSWMRDYHAWMRLALSLKAELRGRRVLDDEQARRLAETAAARSGEPCDPAFVRRVAHPPGGRLNPLILERLAAKFEVDRELIRQALFPAPRRVPEAP